MSTNFRRFIPITKVDEEKREVWGVLAVEEPDASDEIFDYETSKPFFQAWNAQFEKVTDGKSVGNLREMHGKSAAGKFIQMDYDDTGKSIHVGARVVDDGAWKKVQEDVYTGFSIGGTYIKTWKDGALKRYTADPCEGSLVDNPCIPGAVFEVIKADGSKDLRKHRVVVKAKTKTVSGKELAPADFAYVGDRDDISTWKLPIDEPDRIRAAMSRFNQTEGLGSKKHSTAQRIIRAAKSAGIDATEFKSEYAKTYGGAGLVKALGFAGVKLSKGMWEVSRLADALCTLNCIREASQFEAEWENDNSEIPARLTESLKDLADILIDMTAEETSEMFAADAKEVVEVLELAASPTATKIAATETNTEKTKEIHKMATTKKFTKMSDSDLEKLAPEDLKKYYEDFKKYSKELSKHIDGLNKAHGACQEGMAKMAGHLDAMTERDDDENDGDDTKDDGDDKDDENAKSRSAQLKKSIGDQIEKANSRVNKAIDKQNEAIAKQNETLDGLAQGQLAIAQALEKILASPAPAAAAVNALGVVSKDTDNGLKVGEEKKDTLSLIKAAQNSGPTMVINRQ